MRRLAAHHADRVIASVLNRQGQRTATGLRFGHGSDGLASPLAVINLLAFAFHCVLDGLSGLWRDLRDLRVTRRDFFENPRVATCLLLFPHRTALPVTLLEKRPASALYRGPTRA